MSNLKTILKPKDLFRPLEYFKPDSVEETVKLLDKYGDKGQIIAGGTDLMVDKDPKIKAIIDITGLDLNYIKPDGNGVKIGATTTFAEIATDRSLNKSPYNSLSEAARAIGTPQIRNVATIGGNICHASPSADSAPPLLALDATVNIVGPAGERSLDIADFFLGVGENALKKDEMLTEIRLPAFPARTGSAFMKKGRLAACDLAIVNVTVRLTMSDDSICQEARIALGAVAPVPLRAKAAEAMLRGEKLQDKIISNAATQVVQLIKPISDIRSSAEYRKILSCVLVERALKEAATKLS